MNEKLLTVMLNTSRNNFLDYNLFSDDWIYSIEVLNNAEERSVNYKSGQSKCYKWYLLTSMFKG